MSSLLKPSTRSLSTFRPQSLFPLLHCLSLPHTLCLSLCLGLHLFAAHVYCSLPLLSPPHTHTLSHKHVHACMCTQACSERTRHFPTFISLPLLTFALALLAETRNYTSVNLHFSNSIVSLKPELAKESACALPFSKADRYQGLQASRPNPFTP